MACARGRVFTLFTDWHVLAVLPARQADEAYASPGRHQRQ